MSAKKEAPHIEVQGAKVTQSHSNSAHAQRQRIGDYLLERKRATSIELRAQLDVLHPAGRIKELRRRGWHIATIWESHPTECGQLHRVGVYVFMSQPKG